MQYFIHAFQTLHNVIIYYCENILMKGTVSQILI